MPDACGITTPYLQLHGTDNLTVLRQQPTASVDLIYIDPPFNTGGVRARGHSTYNDRWPDGITGFMAFMAPRLEEMHRVLKPTGSLYVHLDTRATHHVRVFLDELFGAENFLNEIIWSYRTGGAARRWFPRKHDTLLLYAHARGQHTFNAQRAGRFRTQGLRGDAEGRPFKSTRQGPLYFDPRGPMVTDVWDIPFLSTVSRERTGYPDQKPLQLLRRVIAASSNPGDLVADYFAGSGTTLEAAMAMGRHALGCDTSERALTIIRRRLDPQAVPGEPRAASDR